MVSEEVIGSAEMKKCTQSAAGGVRKLKNIQEIVSQTMREYRNSNRLSKNDFAKLVGSSSSSISAFENGDRLPSKEIWQNMLTAGVHLPEYPDPSGRMDVPDDFGIRLRSFRKSRGLYQNELGELLSISQVQISRLELGKVKPTKEEFEKLQSIGFDMDQQMPDDTTALKLRLTPDTVEYAAIGEAMLGFRKKNRLTQAQLASLIKITGDQVRHIEHGKCRPKKVTISRMLDLGVNIPLECRGFKPNSISEAILKYREQTGFTQRQVADMIGASVYSITAWEEDKRMPTLDTLCKLRDIGVDFSGTPVGKYLDDDPVRIGKAVRRHRELRDISRFELAEELGISYCAVYTWETGANIPSTAQWRKLLEMGIDFGADEVE